MTRHRSITAIALAAVALAACGKKKQTVVANTGPEDPRVSLAGGLPPTTAEAPAVAPTGALGSFAEAEAAFHAGRVEEARDYFAGYISTSGTVL